MNEDPTHEEQRRPEKRAVFNLGTSYRGSRSRAESLDQYISTLVDDTKSFKV